jgi:hypothetical protein
MRATRVARPDVADVFQDPGLEMSGFTAQGSITHLPADDYEVTVVQKRGEEFVSCGVPSLLTITDAPDTASTGG